ncbi:MAG: DUF695 domain-containing protein [Planctomycetaceae bacterium]|nr:DUF695 domain-containing protein [Planctomycetaceae bacterium]
MSDNWDFYFAKVNDKLASIFVDIGVCEIAPDADHPWLLWVWVCLNHPREDGLCNSEEADTLLQIEDSLTEAVGHAVQGSLVGRITTEGRREFYFYAPSFAGFDDAVVRAMQPFPEHRWDADNKHDPEWSQYLGLLYPTPRDWQRIKNRHVIEQLLKHGDPLKKKRPVFHWAYFAEDSSRDQFVAAVQDRGFAVTHQDTVDDPSCTQPLSVKFEREDNVDWDSMNLVTLDLFELANSLRGDYDGWETSVERET